jgi:predicted permease
VLVPLDLPPEKYVDRDRRLQFLTAAIEQLESSPAISAATPVNAVPFTDVGWLVPVFTGEGQSLEQVLTNPSLNLEAIHPNYFDAFEMPIVRGRPFTAADRENATPVAIVSEDVAGRTWPGQDPIGKRLKMGTLDDSAPWLTVVGVTRPTRYRELTEPRATLYVPAEQLIVTADTFALRTTTPPTALASLVQERVRGIDPDVSVSRVAPFRELLERPLARPRFNASLIGIFGAAALFLAAVGLYAVMAAFVRMRQREIGVRMALGASARNVRALVLWEGVRLSGVGAAIGLAVGLAGNRAIAGLLFEVSPLDPAAMLGATAILVGASALACYLPARRATRVDPVSVLRAD